MLKELILNALIHQDFTIDGSGVMIECFSNRIEITNPGAPLIDVNKIADSHHLSRNPKLVNLMDKLGFNNDLTAGWDTVIKLAKNIACLLQALKFSMNLLKLLFIHLLNLKI